MKRRTGLLFTSAVVLGLVAGTTGGFLIQRARSATPLPPLRQTLITTTLPGAADPRDPLTDDGMKLDGDLRSLLLQKPAGAKDTDQFPVRDWFTIGDLAEYYKKPAEALGRLNSLQFRRAARTAWTLADGTDVEIDLVQFRSSESATSYTAMTQFPADPSLPPIAGTATGTVGHFSTTKDASGRYAMYGLVQHGDVVEQVFVNRKQSMPSNDDVVAITKGQADLL
jgi:hypothetical protein